jgi:hypothetical protein
MVDRNANGLAQQNPAPDLGLDTREGLKIALRAIFRSGYEFNDEERAKSPAATAHTINNINIEQVGAFVQRADNSVVQGGVDSTLSLDGVRQLIKQVEELFPSADLPSGVKKILKGRYQN